MHKLAQNMQKKMTKKSFVKNILCLTLTGIIGASLMVPATAEEAYQGYLYNWWNEAVPSQSGYVPEKQVSGLDLGIGDLKEPKDMFISKKNEIYIADTKYIADSTNEAAKGRIVKTNLDLTEVIATYTQVDLSQVSDWIAQKQKAVDEGTLDANEFARITSKNFSSPHGIFVSPDDILYVADTENDRVIAGVQSVDANGNGVYTAKQIYTRPPAKDYESNLTFQPRKVVVDSGKNVYVNVKSITRGAIEFRENGEFSRYYGANRVTRSAEAMLRAFWASFMTEEQRSIADRNVAAEFSNFDIDDNNFVYTVTEVRSANIDVLKKMSPGGINIYEKQGISDQTFGDFYQIYYMNQVYSSSIIDVDVENGVVSLLDLKTGRVFVYDDEGLLLFIYGGLGDQKGLFSSPTAVETKGQKSYVLDERKNSVTVFKQTEFGEIVHEAIQRFNKGDYQGAKALWEDVLRRDNNYWFAYIGMGYANLMTRDYETAMDYYYMKTRGGYNQAFKGYRMEFIRANFGWILGIVIGVVVILYVISFILSNKRLKKQKLEAKGKRE